MALKDAVAEIVGELQTIPGLRRVPDAPPENNDQFPFAVVYPLTGTYALEMTSFFKGLHSINIELHVARKDLPRAYAQVMDLIDTIPLELAKKHAASDFSYLATFGIIEYTFGPLSWAGVETLGITYTINQVKIETSTS